MAAANIRWSSGLTEAHACDAAHHEAEQRAVAVDEEAILGVSGVCQNLQHPVQVVHCTTHL